MDEAERRFLISRIGVVRSQLARFGSAHDARDRGYDAAADAIDREGNEAIRAAFAHAPALAGLLPKTHARILAGDDLADLGFEISDEIAAALGRLGEA